MSHHRVRERRREAERSGRPNRTRWSPPPGREPGGRLGVDLYHESWAYGTSEGFQLKDEATPDTSGMGPGTVTVACLPTSRSSSSDPGVPTATLTIVDPDGLYVPWELACGFGEQLRMTIMGARTRIRYRWSGAFQASCRPTT
jgi:hypothetical protein